MKNEASMESNGDYGERGGVGGGTWREGQEQQKKKKIQALELTANASSSTDVSPSIPELPHV